jgi:hypothetical protein
MFRLLREPRIQSARRGRRQRITLWPGTVAIRGGSLGLVANGVADGDRRSHDSDCGWICCRVENVQRRWCAHGPLGLECSRGNALDGERRVLEFVLAAVSCINLVGITRRIVTTYDGQQ